MRAERLDPRRAAKGGGWVGDFIRDEDIGQLKASCEKLKESKLAQLAAALAELERAAWARRWSDLKAARVRVGRLLPGVEIPQRRPVK